MYSRGWVSYCVEWLIHHGLILLIQNSCSCGSCKKGSLMRATLNWEIFRSNPRLTVFVIFLRDWIVYKVIVRDHVRPSIVTVTVIQTRYIPQRVLENHLRDLQLLNDSFWRLYITTETLFIGPSPVHKQSVLWQWPLILICFLSLNYH